MHSLLSKGFMYSHYWGVLCDALLMHLFWMIHNFLCLKTNGKLPWKSQWKCWWKSSSVFWLTLDVIEKPFLQASEEISYFNNSHNEFKAMEKIDITLEAPRGRSKKSSFCVVINRGINHFSLVMWQKSFVTCEGVFIWKSWDFASCLCSLLKTEHWYWSGINRHSLLGE